MLILWENNKREGNPKRKTPTSLPLVAFDIGLFLNAFPPRAGQGGRKQHLKGVKDKLPTNIHMEGSSVALPGSGVTVPLRMGAGVPQLPRMWM